MEDEDKLNQLHFENELKRIKLQLETGAEFINNTGVPLPPEIESQWLDNIRKYEESIKNCKKIKIYDFIGRYPFMGIKELPPKHLYDKLTELKDILRSKGIVLETIYRVSNRELYRFITEELFNFEIDDAEMPGWETHFIYEEFHPNHKNDIKKNSNNFIKLLLKDFDLEFMPVVDNPGFKEKLTFFNHSFSSFRLHKFKIHQLAIEGEKAEVGFEIEYSAIIEEGKEKIDFRGMGRLHFVREFDYWSVAAIIMPGLE